MKRFGNFFVYIVQCNNGTYYTGYTNNLENRLKLHKNGRGAKYLRGKAPLKLVYSKKYKYYKTAFKKELEIKTYNKKKKEKLIKSQVSKELK